jgi:uncharacterized protein with ParB-like and HNH nuclease domain
VGCIRTSVATAAVMKTLREMVAGRRIIVPPIQRNFAWNVGDTSKNPAKSQSSKLIEDLEYFHKLRKENYVEKYFLGNIIAVVEEQSDLTSEENEWSLLDGQQRITSFSLMMKAIYYRLDNIDTADAIELQNELDIACLKLDESRFSDDSHPYPIFHRRESDRDCFANFLGGNIDDIPRNSNMANVAFSYYKHFKRKSLPELQGFLETVLDHVIVSVTLTDSMTMGYQMFQTANDRGLSLSAYDMFRAFVVRKIEVDLIIGKEVRKVLHNELNKLEDMFQSSSWGENEKAREGNLKSFITVYMIIRSGNFLRQSTIINHIDREIHRIISADELAFYLQDMQAHVYTWKDQIYPGKPSMSLYKGKMIRRLHRLGVRLGDAPYLSIEGSTIRPRETKVWLLSVVEWTIFKQLLKHGKLGGKTDKIYQQMSSDVHRIWKHFSDRNYTLEDCTTFRTKWLVEQVEGERLISSMSSGLGENASYALLHRLEPKEGLSESDPGRKTQETSIIRLANKKAAGEELYDAIGNFFLIPGGRNGGWNTTKVKAHNEEVDHNKRIESILQMMTSTEHNMEQELRDSVNSVEFQAFIRRRSKKIIELLNVSYEEFMDSTPIAPIVSRS